LNSPSRVPLAEYEVRPTEKTSREFYRFAGDYCARDFRGDLANVGTVEVVSTEGPNSGSHRRRCRSCSRMPAAKAPRSIARLPHARIGGFVVLSSISHGKLEVFLKAKCVYSMTLYMFNSRILIVRQVSRSTRNGSSTT